MNTPAITDRFRSALLPQNRLATVIGSVFGASVPVAVYRLVHAEIDVSGPPLYLQPKFYLVCAGLMFSALSVYGVARDVFQSPAKAFGFVVLLEGAMSLSDTPALALSMLGILAVINAVSASVALSAQQRETRRSERVARKEGGDVLHIAPPANRTPSATPKRTPRTSLSRRAAK
jgi:hypothetical protein